MADVQYDLPKKIQRLFHEKEKQRLASREAYLKRITNPYLAEQPEIDQSIIRYHAMLHAKPEYFRANLKTSLPFLFCVVLPVSFLTWKLWSVNNVQEKQIRSGQVAYKDRIGKML